MDPNRKQVLTNPTEVYGQALKNLENVKGIEEIAREALEHLLGNKAKKYTYTEIEKFTKKLQEFT